MTKKSLIWISALVMTVTALAAFIAGVYFARDQRVPEVVVMNPSWSQNALLYINIKKQDNRLMSKKQQNQAALYSLQQFFAPWADYPQEKINSVLKYQKNQLASIQYQKQYGINFHAYSRHFWQAIIENMNLTDYPNKNKRAIIVKNSALRVIPTDLPAFAKPTTSMTYPFDNFASSPMWVGQPIRILQQSKDGAWYLASYNNIAGWVQRDKFVWVDQAYIDHYKNSRFVAITQDNIPVKTLDSEFVFYSRIGSIYPLHGQQVMVPAVDGKLKPVQLPSIAYTTYPMKITEHNMATIMNALMGEPYTWGLDGYRECSLTLKNLLMTFGIWLPKYSQDQLVFLPYVNFSKLSDQEKIALIRKKAQPFLTLLGTPNHVTLYIGRYKNHDMVFQDHWGYHTRDRFGDTGRLVIGETIIDSLVPAKQDKRSTMQSYLLNELSKMTFLSGYPVTIKPSH